GWAKEEVIGRTIKDLGYLTDQSDFAQAAAILRGRGRLRDYEFQFRTKTGDTRWGMVSAEPIDIGGEDYILSTTTDITARKQIEAVLERQSQRAALRADITSALSRRCSLPGILDRCAAAIGARLKPAFTGIWLLQEPDGPLELAASFGEALDAPGRIGENAF